jgi:hypothetical protein
MLKVTNSLDSKVNIVVAVVAKAVVVVTVAAAPCDHFEPDQKSHL